jgi:hypothetical protein
MKYNEPRLVWSGLPMDFEVGSSCVPEHPKGSSSESSAARWTLDRSTLELHHQILAFLLV